MKLQTIFSKNGLQFIIANSDYCLQLTALLTPGLHSSYLVLVPLTVNLKVQRNKNELVYWNVCLANERLHADQRK